MRPSDPSGESSHSVMVASKIASKSFGSCKMVNIVWLGLPEKGRNLRLGNPVDPRRWPAMIDALQKIRRDIKDNKLQGKAYINISGGFQDATFPVTDSMQESMAEAIKGVTKLDALVIMAAGNNGRPIWSDPQRLGQIYPRVVVTGAVNITGNLWTGTSTADFVRLYAVGSNTRVIGSNLGSPYGPISVSGTSFSRFPVRTSKKPNASDHGNRRPNFDRSVSLPTYDRSQIQWTAYEFARQGVG